MKINKCQSFISIRYWVIENVVVFQLVCLILYLVPAYYLTGQPLEVTRFFYFVLFNVITSLTAQGYGFMIGAMLPVTVNNQVKNN